MAETLNRDEVLQSLAQLPGWEFDEDQIHKIFEFDNFKQALEFVNKIGSLAEKANHHPEIGIRYNKVEIRLSTHEASAVTEKDIKLARQIEEINL